MFSASGGDGKNSNILACFLKRKDQLFQRFGFVSESQRLGRISQCFPNTRSLSIFPSFQFIFFFFFFVSEHRTKEVYL